VTRKLIAMIASAAKSPEELKAEAHQALQKYFDANPQSRPPNYPSDLTDRDNPPGPTKWEDKPATE
jgi:hypothetical protein